MQDKLQKLFKEINIEENLLSYFDNASIDKIVVYDKNKLLDFIINTENIIPIEIYNNVLYKLISYFNTIETVKLIIKPSKVDNSLIQEYYFDIMKNICLDRSKYNIFLDREISVNDNTIIIKAYNKAECTNMLALKQEIISKMNNYGFNIDIDIDLILDGDIDLKNKIESEKEVTITNPVISNQVHKTEQNIEKKPTFRADISPYNTKYGNEYGHSVAK